VNTTQLEIGGRTLTVETGHVAQQASGAVTVRMGDTMLLVTAVMAATPREGIDFFPLTCDYEEKLYAAGKIPGGFIRREGRPSEQAILNSRLIDRPIRPLFPKDFRNEVVKFALRYRAQHDGKNPAWTAYEKIRNVIEKRMFTQVEDLLPVISFESKKDSDTETKHNEFVKRMLARGYTQRQVRRLVEWYMRVNKAG